MTTRERLQCNSSDASPQLEDVRHAFKRMQAGIASHGAFMAKAHSILKRDGQSATNLSTLDPKCYPAVLVAAREALALDLAAFAPIFPLKPDGKKPCSGTNGHLEATKDTKRIRAWVRERPNCNWGLRCGDPSAADIDTKNGKQGAATWESLVKEHSEPDTRTALTPSGGRHVFVAGDVKTGTNTLGSGIDTRGSSGYVVAPGSHVVANGDDISVTDFYRWENDRPVVSVPWINDCAKAKADTGDRGTTAVIELDQPENIARAVEMLKDFASSSREVDAKGQQKNGPAIQGEGGDNWTFRVACMVGDLGVSEEMCLEIMAENFNEACQPPWDITGTQSLTTKVHSAYQSRTSPPGVDTAEADFGLPAQSEQPAKRNRLKGRRLSELAELKDPIWILPGAVPDGFTVVYGKPKRGKSFWVIELSVCVAANKPFHDVPLGKSGRVLYIAAEGGAAHVRNRVQAVLDKREIAAADIEQNWELVDCGIDLNSQTSIDEFLKANPGQWSLIVIDTLARNMSGDENATKDMNTAVAGCDCIRRKTGAAVILVHHEGWAAARPRGAIALFGALDALIHVSRGKDDGFTNVEVEELRDAALPDNAVTVHRLVDGVLEAIPAEPKGVEKLLEREGKMRKVLVGLCMNGPAIPVKQWRAAVENAGLLEGAKKTREKAWLRARQHMAKAGCIKITGNSAMPWTPEPTDDFDA